jgi:hypothetical protein
VWRVARREAERYLDLDLANAVLDKLDYNQNRADHKLENRAKEGGKKF